MAKQEQNSIIEPSEEELALYNQFIQDVPDHQIDFWATEYYDLVQKEEIKISFPKYLIDKIVRPIREGDTIQIQDESGGQHVVFCILRQEIEETNYLAFCKVDEESETILHDSIYLFFVCGNDNIGMETIDIVPAGEESQRILSIMEENINVTEIEESFSQAQEQEEE